MHDCGWLASKGFAADFPGSGRRGRRQFLCRIAKTGARSCAADERRGCMQRSRASRAEPLCLASPDDFAISFCMKFTRADDASAGELRQSSGRLCDV
jgi:hypothetical protein